MTPANAHHLDHSPGIIDDIPTEHKVPDVSSDEDADDDIPVEVHGEKHDEVGHGELTGGIKARIDCWTRVRRVLG